MKDKMVTFAASFRRAQNLLETSLDLINNWCCDVTILEEFLQINHRGWELLFKTLCLLRTEDFKSNHSLKKQIGLLEQNNVFNVSVQNLNEFFFSEISMDYYEMLDNLFADTKARYADINDIIGASSSHHVADAWINKYAYQDKLDYSLIKNKILEINFINLRFISLHFSQNEEDKIYNPIFSKYYNYWNDLFLTE